MPIAESDPTPVIQPALAPGPGVPLPPGPSGPGPITPSPEALIGAVEVVIDGENVSTCVRTGSVTRRLNRPAQATVELYSECAIGGACSRIKISIGGTLYFHGMVTQISTQADEDGAIMSVYTAMDPMFLWQWRPARDGLASGDPGDFSNPTFFSGVDFPATGPQILQAILEQSEDISQGTDDAEGPLFLELGLFATGIVDLSGAPTDWPMSIAEVFELMSSTGTLDAIITPIDSGGNMGELNVFNGDYGNNLTGDVVFSYATGENNVKNIRMVEDSANICNKLWYYLGPRVLTAQDPAGDQHWRANVTGSYPDEEGQPGNPLNSPPYDVTQAAIRLQRDQNRIDCGVRMEVRIYDAQGDENPAAYRHLYYRLWQMESWLRSQPRTLVHITPIRQSETMQLAPGVTPVPVGAFNIGDLITITAGSIVRGGFTGAQRVYGFTVTWDEDGVIEVGELQTSADQEGI